MNGLGVSLVFFLAVSLLHDARLILGGSVQNDRKLSEGEKATRLNVLGGLNVSSIMILENLKRYEDLLVTSSLKRLPESNGTCSQALGEFFHGLAKRKIWTLHMLDSSSVLQSGLLEANLWDLGAFDECLAISVNDEDLRFDGQHCLINLKLAVLGTSTSGVLAALGGSISYTFSLCLPSVCSTDALSDSLADLSTDIDFFLDHYNYSITLSVDPSNCHTASSKALSAVEIAGIVVPALFIGIALICTIIDAIVFSSESRNTMKKMSPVVPYVTAFSYLQNGKRLMDTRVSEDSIQVLHSLKFICIAWVALGHRFVLSAEGPLVNTLKLSDYIKKWTTMLLLNAPLSVDVFFIISGILNTYSYLNSTSRGSKTILAHLIGYVHRYVRLTPAYAMMILVTATWLYRLGDGPYWDVLVGDARDDCTHNWWSGLLYINNYYNPSDNCMLQSWYLAVDMQLFWLSPLVLYSLWRWPRVGLAKLAVLVVVSIIIPFYVAYVDEIKAPIPITLNTSVVNKQMNELYMPTHTKTISYVLGMLCGYVIHRVKKEKMRITINPWLNVTIWILALASMALGVFGGYDFFQLDSAYNKVESSLYIAFYKLFWSVGVIWIIFACTAGYGGFINTFLSYKLWMPLGRLTYCIYLTHAAVILSTIGRIRIPQYFSYYTMILTFFGELVIAILTAALLSLTIESPLMAVENILRRGNRRKKHSNVDNPNFKNNVPTNGSAPAINLPNVLSRD